MKLIEITPLTEIIKEITIEITPTDSMVLLDLMYLHKISLVLEVRMVLTLTEG